jgi:molybdopterin-guanine dinucleotide biosynthesis protein A
MTTATPVHDITAVILAGGKARRMGGTDKGLINLHGRTMVDYIIDALRPQVANMMMNANRNPQQYGVYGLPVVADMLGDYFGPLAGMATGMHATDRPYIVTVPCDSPFIPGTLVETLYRSLNDSQADISVAHDGVRMQPVFAMLRCELLPGLLAYLDKGGRKIDTWYNQQRLAMADFSDSPDTFLNLNTPEDKLALENIIAGKRTETST